jgi:hypothetical protein
MHFLFTILQDLKPGTLFFEQLNKGKLGLIGFRFLRAVLIQTFGLTIFLIWHIGEVHK